MSAATSWFSAVLKKDKRKLKEDYSTRTLKPLLARIKETDYLIDQFVYKLYGLTGDEFVIVKGAT
jgi:hypothetical protein